MSKSVFIRAGNCVTPLGLDVETNWRALLAGQSGICKMPRTGYLSDFYASTLADLAIDTSFAALPDSFASPKASPTDFSRLEKMLILSLHPLLAGQVISPRTGLIISTTKGNITALQAGRTEDARLFTLAKRLAAYFGFQTLPMLVSNACVSGVLAVMVGRRMLQMNTFDDVYVLAGDEVSPFVVAGFQSFQAMSPEPCRPFDTDRQGLTLGEAAAALHLSSERAEIQILGDSSINDANHISGPSRTGEGLYRSMKRAIQESDIAPSDIDYLSAHGTATRYNDEMEAFAIHRMGLEQVPVNSLKGYYGHTLGCSGLLELIITMKSLSENTLLPSKGLRHAGLSKTINLIETRTHKPLHIALKTASGFGGSNAAIVLKKEER